VQFLLLVGLLIYFPIPLDNVPVVFYLCFRWFWKEGSELLTYQICQNHVQRLRMFIEVVNVPGSRGLDPQAITTCAHWRLSNPRHENVRLCKSEPWMTACVKSTGYTGHLQISAQIAVFLQKALGHRATTTTTNNRSNGLEAGRETFPPLSFHGPP
jgi:hypothetical protein